MMTPTKVLHLWGLDGKPSLISPESIALCWFLNDNERSTLAVDVVYSNNTDLSSTGELPLLIDGSGKKTVGLYSIVEVLSEEEDKDKSLLAFALLQFVLQEMRKCTMYQLYLNPVNYTEYTSKVYSYLLHWPFWYNTPLNNRSAARELCRDLTISIPDDDENVSLTGGEIDMSDKATDLAQSKVFKVTRDSKRQQNKKLQELKNNSKFTTKLDGILAHWESARPSLGSSYIPADLLLAAHFKVQMALPQGELLRNHLSSRFPTLYHKVNKLIETNDKLNVPNRDPTFNESGNILNSVYNFLRMSV
ncbi:unnamed protein product [Kluyveromyces dobzhanskii CBS 2104]|uniref:WGS project CCBQ000000000 data, contig 00058 n=1 Tax=Kluyveromyces dobzhanskii CBS 2104 TaxID=1427455 RepID=A0A0A8LDS6_9SACH|nr:unnamed protein product [Kluyveromyces dobzhanskii CBS 2104]